MNDDNGLQRLQLVWGAQTHPGMRRPDNQDSLLAATPVFLVADGMGGHHDGEVASRLALEPFQKFVGRSSATMEETVDAIEQAAKLVAAIPGEGAMAGTTITGVLRSTVADSEYWLVVNIGDSRTYRLTLDGLEQVSVDHSSVQELLDAGQIDAAEAAVHPERNVITKAIGAGSSARPDYWLLPATAGERMLVCSDGLTRELEAAEIEQVLRDTPHPHEAASELVSRALRRGARDNVSVIVVDALLPEHPNRGPALAGFENEDTVPSLLARHTASHGEE